MDPKSNIKFEIVDLKPFIELIGQVIQQHIIFEDK